MARSLSDLATTGSYIDSRDLIERFEELDAIVSENRDNGEDVDEDIGDELEELRQIVEEGDSLFADWQYGEGLIPEDEFETYARELADDIGAINRNADWPLSYIDWEAAANALKQDYSEIEIRGTTYLGRSG